MKLPLLAALSCCTLCLLVSPSTAQTCKDQINCQNLYHLCGNPNIAPFCKKTCGGCDIFCFDADPQNCPIYKLTGQCMFAKSICKRSCGGCGGGGGGGGGEEEPEERGWGDWGDWEECDKPCGKGKESRYRECLGGNCRGKSSQERNCNLGKCQAGCKDKGFVFYCAINKNVCANNANVRENCQKTCNLCGDGGDGGDGGDPGPSGWNDWGPWGDCSETCGPGQETRERTCQGDISTCPGQAIDVRNCNEGACCRDNSNAFFCAFNKRSCSSNANVQQNCRKSCKLCGGGQGSGSVWSEWNSWDECSETCGPGQKTRTRTCIGDNNGCPGPARETQQCNEEPCDTCEDKSSSFYCRWNKGSCSREFMQKNCQKTCDACNGVSSPVFSEWTDWTVCSVKCGSGTQKRTRECIQGTCEGQTEETQGCDEGPCNRGTGDEGFSEWSGYDVCSLECGGGVHSRYRHCVTQPCTGHSQETVNCNENECPGGGNCRDSAHPSLCKSWKQQGFCEDSQVISYCPKTCRKCADPQAAKWSEYGPCSVPCGVGQKTRSRLSEIQTVTCIIPCDGEGGEDQGVWSPWTPYGPCSVNCGGGTQAKTRTCSTGTGNCIGPAEKSRPCGTNICRGNWGSWKKWSTCTKPCGGGEETRTRECVGQGTCEGEAKQSRPCNTHPCQGKWGPWGPWGSCSKNCDGGEEKRTRQCLGPAQCNGQSEETKQCNTQACPGWGPWGQWGVCNVACGGGEQERVRSCSVTGECTGDRKEKRDCATDPCPSWKPWGQWGACTVACGGGEQQRVRFCSVPEQCTGDRKEKRDCATNRCANWSPWGQWEACKVTCGGGEQHRTRSCSVTGECAGNRKDTRDCATNSCPNWGPWTSWTACSEPCGPGERTRTRRCSVKNKCPSDPVGRAETEKCNLQPCSDPLSWSACTRTCGWGTRRRKKCKTCSEVIFESCSEFICPPAACVFGGLKERHSDKGSCCSENNYESCGKSNLPDDYKQRIIGGEEAKPKQWPFTVAFHSTSFCAGTLISDEYVLSAAHCFTNDRGKKLDTTAWNVYAGFTKLATRNKSPGYQQSKIDKVHVHPDYAFPTCDIVVVKLKTKFQLTAWVQPVCLPGGEIPAVDADCHAVGWGESTQPGLTTNELQEVSLKILDRRICRQSYKKDSSLSDFAGFLNREERFVCAGSITKGIDSCKGDSGGPLVCQRCSSCKWFITGIVSFGPYPCGVTGTPGIYTQVADFETWIYEKSNIRASPKACT